MKFYFLPMLVGLLFIIGPDIWIYLKIRNRLGNRCLRLIYWLPAVFFVLFFVGMRFFSNDLPDYKFMARITWILWLFALIYIPKVIYTIFDVAGRAMIGFCKTLGLWLSRIGAGIAVMLVVLFVYAAFIGRTRVHVKEVDLAYRDLPEQLDGFKIVQFSDLHIGKRVNGMSMLDDQRYILRQILDIAEKRQVSVLLIAGDVYDKASPSAEAVTVFDAFLADAVAAGLRVLAIPGNHDSAERIAYAQGLLEKQGVCLPPVYAGEVERVELEDEHGPVEFWLLPFLKPGDVRRFFPDEEIGDDYSAALRAVLGACAIDQRKRNVVLSHQLVTACGTAPDRADDEIKLGGMDNVDVSVYDAFDYVALGHVHRPQRVGRDTEIGRASCRERV